MLRHSAATLALLAAIAAALMTAAAEPTHAAPVGCDKPNPATGQCTIHTGDPGTQPTQTPGNSGQPANDKTPQCIDGYTGNPIPCTDPTFGSWSNQYDCYLKLANPQPPKTDQTWGGHTDGAVYDCIYNGPVAIPGVNGTQIWLAGPPPGMVDPAVLARQAIDAMQLHAITIGIAPKPGRDSMGYVGLPTYLWVDAPAPQTLGPITRSATAGAVTVTATATVNAVIWNMGDGITVRCTGGRAAGTPYQASFGARPSPTCGHYFGRPGTYTVNATAHWVINWAGGGANGTIQMDLTATTQIRIGEVQVLVQ